MYLCKIQLESVAQGHKINDKQFIDSFLLQLHWLDYGQVRRCCEEEGVVRRRCCDRKPVLSKISGIQCKKCENHSLIIAVDHKTCSVRMNFNLKFMSNKFTCQIVFGRVPSTQPTLSLNFRRGIT